MASVQEIDPDLEILLILDAPQLEGLAPELAIFRDRVAVEAAKIAGASCSGCAKRKVQRQLRRIARDMTKLIFSSSDLQGVMDALYTSARQAAAKEEVPA